MITVLIIHTYFLFDNQLKFLLLVMFHCKVIFFQDAERLLFDHRLSYEEGKPIVMKKLYQKLDEAVAMLHPCP